MHSRALIKIVGRVFISAVILASIVICFSVFVANNSAEHHEPRMSGNDFSGAKPRTVRSHERLTDIRDVVPFEIAIKIKERYNISSEDLLVLLHIQKTGGTAFERHLVHDLQISTPCSCNNERRRCHCPRPRPTSNAKLQSQAKTLADFTWLISRFSIGWACGLHPDFTQLKRCLLGLRRLFFLTFLRHPLHRFVSEFRHVRRGATWKSSKGHCRNHNTQLCYKDQPHWSNVSLDDFINCPNNMAINRQTRMLASYNDHLCDESHVENNILLASAMNNLDKMAFFGICEQQRASQLLFERTFGLKFSPPFKQSNENETREFIAKLPGEVRDRILELNSLDLKLYNYAVDLFAFRCNQLTNSDDCGARILESTAHLGRIGNWS